MIDKICRCIVFLACMLFGHSCIWSQTPTVETNEKNTYWTKEKREAYGLRNVDSTKWNMKMLEVDLDGNTAHKWPTKPAISNFPSPVAKYKSPGGTLKFTKLNIENKHIHGYSIGWAKGDFNAHLFQKNQDPVRIYFNILILMDDPKEELRAAQIVSRNHPHYLATGSQKTKIGKVDWAQMALADDSNYAIVSQRIFDLNYGRTILVAPQKDGSLRFLQLSSVDSFKDLNAFLVDEVAPDQKVIDFFLNPNAIE